MVVVRRRPVGSQRPALHDEPVEIGRLRAVFQEVVELEEAAAGVVEDAIQHHTDAAGVRSVEQPPQGGIAAQHRVHLEVIVRVVAMIGG